MPGANILYKLRVLTGVRFNKLNYFLNEAHKRSGKSKRWLLNDILHCSRKFGSGYHDYIMYHFYDLNDEERDTYMTRMRSKMIMAQFNDTTYADCYDNKSKFDKIFAEYVRRDNVDLTNCDDKDIIDFYENHDTAFAKMLDLACGKGAELIEMKNFDSGYDFCKYVKLKGFGVLEEVVKNHPDLQKVNPYAVNTMRMITLIGDDGNPNLLFAAQKFGVKKIVVDVFGMHAPINTETGIIEYPFHSGKTTTDEFYTKHPVSGVDLINFKVPFFKEAKEMILKASMVVPELRYVGWDVAITPDGPLIIEGNNYTSYDYMQLPGQSDSNIGIIPEILKIAPSFKYK